MVIDTCSIYGNSGHSRLSDIEGESVTIINTYIQTLLDNMPEYVSDWYIKLKASDHQAKTCQTYVNDINTTDMKTVQKEVPADSGENGIYVYKDRTQIHRREWALYFLRCLLLIFSQSASDKS